MPVPATVATIHNGILPSLNTIVTSLFRHQQRTFQLVKKVTGKQNTENKNQQQTQVERGSVQFNRLFVGINIAVHDYSYR